MESLSRKTPRKILTAILAIALLLMFFPGTAFAATSLDYKQFANELGSEKWIGSALQKSNSQYYEGMSVPQRLVLEGMTTGAGEHYVTFKHQFTKGGKYAYDFLTSWAQARATALSIGGQTWPDAWQWMGLKQSLVTAFTADPLNHNTAVIPETLTPSGNHLAKPKSDKYEAVYGNRNLDVFGNAAIDTVTVEIGPLEGVTSGDSQYPFTVKWTGAATDVMILYGAHIAVGVDQQPGQGIGWGSGMGASSISGAPYHNMLNSSSEFNGTSSQDNQLMGSAVDVFSAIEGMKFNDADGDGVYPMEAADTPLSGWEIWADMNGNGTKDTGEPTTTTGSDGKYYLLILLQPQVLTTVNIYETLKTGYVQTYPWIPYNRIYQPVSISPGEIKSGYDFGNFPPAPAIDVEKYVWDGTAFQDADLPTGPYLIDPSNHKVIFKFVITNTGNVALTSVTLSDLPAIATFYDDQALTTPFSFTGFSLAAGASKTVYAALTWAAGQQTDTATVSGYFNTTEKTDSDPANYFGSAPAINIVKDTRGNDGVYGDGVFVAAGFEVKWRYTVTNTGNVPIGSVAVTDSISGVTPAAVVQGASDPYPGKNVGDLDGDGLLDLTETWIFSATGTAIAGAYSNIGTSTGTANGQNVSDTDPSSYTGFTPKIKVTKVFEATPAGKTYSLLIENLSTTGTPTLSIAVTDPKLTFSDSFTLATGATKSYANAVFTEKTTTENNPYVTATLTINGASVSFGGEP